jgi:hypothetical protein
MSALPEAGNLEASLREYPDLFSGKLGTLRGAQYDIELVGDDLIIAHIQSLNPYEIIQRSS